MINNDRHDLKISIIEDSEIHRTWLHTELSAIKNVKVVSINRFGRNGIHSIKTHHPDMVLIDFQLEDMTGDLPLKK